MTTDVDDTRGSPDRICGRCAHAESEHEEHDTELGGQTVRRLFCVACDDWCEFFPRD